MIHKSFSLIILFFLGLMTTGCNPTFSEVESGFLGGIRFDPSKTSMTLSTHQVTTRGAGAIITIKMFDQNGAPFYTSDPLGFKFDLIGGTSKGSFAIVTSVGQGVYTSTFTGTVGGSVGRVSVSIDGEKITSSRPEMQVLSDNASLVNSTISLSAATVISGSNITITLTTRDASNIQLLTGGFTVSFNYVGGTSSGIFSAVTDHLDGTYSATFTGGAPGTATSIGAMINGAAISSALPTVSVIAATADAANSTITGSGSVTANGTSTSTVSITLKDVANGAIVGVVPTFSATDTGSTNAYGVCSATNASGISTCTLASTKAETKTLTIETPVSKADGSVVFVAGAASVLTSTIEGSDPTLADGIEVCDITITLKDVNNNAIAGATPTYDLTGTLNTKDVCSATNASGVSTCEVTSTKAEGKTISLLTPVAMDGNTVDFNPDGINLQVPIEMIDLGANSHTSAKIVDRTETSLNPADYVAQTNTYIFEVVAINTGADDVDLTLVDSAGTFIASSQITILHTTDMTRYQVVFTPNPTADTYRIHMTGSVANATMKLLTARMIVEQVKATSTKIYIPLISSNFDSGSGANGTATNVTNTNSITFTQASAHSYNLWTRSDAQYNSIAGSNPWTLETITSTSTDNTASTTVALFDKTNNQEIPESSITTIGPAVQLQSVSFASDATNFDDGDTIELRIKTSDATRTARIHKAGLWLKLKYLTRVEVYRRIMARRAANPNISSPNSRFYWDEGAWSNPTVYFQFTGNGTGANMHSLLDTGLNDVGIAGTIVAGSEINPGTNTYSIHRTGAITLTDNNRYIYNIVRTGGSPVIGSGFVVIRASE